MLNAATTAIHRLFPIRPSRSHIVEISAGLPASHTVAQHMQGENRVQQKQPSRNAKRKKRMRQMRRQGLLPPKGNDGSHPDRKHRVCTHGPTHALASSSGPKQPQPQGQRVAQARPSSNPHAQEKQAKPQQAVGHHLPPHQAHAQARGVHESAKSSSDDSAEVTSENKSNSDDSSAESSQETSELQSSSSSESSSEEQASSASDSSKEEEELQHQEQPTTQIQATHPVRSRSKQCGKFADAASPRHAKAATEVTERDTHKDTLPIVDSSQPGACTPDPQRLPNGFGVSTSKCSAIESLPELVNGVSRLQ